MTVQDATKILRDAGVEHPAREARLLLTHALGLPHGSVPSPFATPPDSFAGLIRRRAAREPLAFITGRQGFWTLDLAVSPATLIPRADSETLIEALLAIRPDRARVASILDLGTGTGALLLAALAEYPAAFGIGIDRNEAACALARDNAQALGQNRAAFVCADWAAPIAGRFDVVLANPPYITHADIAGLDPEVARFEPALALDGGSDGLDAYRAILPTLHALLSPGGVALFEHGAGQGPAVASLVAANGLRLQGSRADLGGLDRVALVDRA